MSDKPAWLQLQGKNIPLALRTRDQALANQSAENQRLRDSGFNLDAAGYPNWDRATWESYRTQFGSYPWGPAHRPDHVEDAPVWVKQICGIGLTPAERMEAARNP